MLSNVNNFSFNPCSWLPPPIRVLKVNFDAIFSKNNAAAACDFCYRTNDPVDWQGFTSQRNWGFQHTIFEGAISAIDSRSMALLCRVEPEVEKAILRRSAIILVMSFVRSLDKARSEGRKVGFGFVGQSLDDMTRILKYVEGIDNDSLVRQHARDVIEGMESWQMNSLIPLTNTRGGTGIQDLNASGIENLAGLSVTPTRGNTNEARPRIEEIE